MAIKPPICLTNKYIYIMFPVKASIVVMSHLSDTQFEISIQPIPFTRINQRINFAKFIILECNGDLTKEIDPDELWKKFIEKH